MTLVEIGANVLATSLTMIIVSCAFRPWTVEFLTNVGLIPARVAVELVDAPLEVGTM